MGGLFRLFQRKDKKTEDFAWVGENTIKVDFHSHLLVNIDDGSTAMEDSLEMLAFFQQEGYEHLIVTPHVMGDFYRNSRQTILEKVGELQKAASEAGMSIKLSASAEYYMDEFLGQLMANGEVLPFGDNYLLLETSFYEAPQNWEYAIFEAVKCGFKPILAHPERYLFLHHEFEKYQKLKDMGVFFQVNLMSLAGYYSNPVKAVAHKLVQQNMVEFVSSDMHTPRHIEPVRKGLHTHLVQEVLKNKLLNNTLL